MADNETKIRLTAVDGATATLNQIQGAAKELTGSFTRLQGALGAIGATAALGGLVSSISSAVKAAAAMDELSQKTGIATEQLSALDYAMRREGVSTEAFAKGIKELSKNMVEAGDATTKAGKIFAELGVNARGGTREALLTIADSFQKIPDGATKAALAVELFGKAGMDLIPALNNGAEGIRQIEEQARRLGITFDSEAGRAAKKFSDDMFALNESSKALGVSIATKLLPNLQSISGAMREAVEQGGLLTAVWVGLGGLGNLIFNGTEANQAREQIAGLTKQIEELEAATVNAEGKQLANLIAALDVLNPKLEAAKQRLKDLTEAPPAPPKVEADPRLKALQDRLDALLRGGGKAAIDTFGKELDALILKLDTAAAGFSSDFPKAVAVLNTALVQGRIPLTQHAELMGKLIAQQPAFKAGLEAEAKLHESVTKALAEGVSERRRYVDSIREEIDRQRFANDTLGMTREQIAALTVARLEERLEILKASGAMEDELEALAEEIRLRKELAGEISKGERGRENIQRASEDLRAQTALWASLGDAAGDFFADLVLNGKSAFDNLREWAKRFLADMISIFARQFFLNIVAGSGGTFSVAASAAGGAGNILSGASTLASGASLLGTGIGQTGIAQFYGGLTGAIQGPGLTGGAGLGASVAPYIGALGIAAAVVAGMLTADGQFSRGWRIDNNRSAGGSNPFARLGTFASSQEDSFYRSLGFNDRWAAILSGSSVVSRIFGRRARQNDAFGVMGDVGPGGFTGQNWQDWSEQGGWFSSTRRGTDLSPFSTEQTKFFDDVFKGISGVVEGFARLTGGDPSRALAGYSKPFNFQLNENGEPLSEEALTKLFGDFFGGVLQEQVDLLLRDAGRTDIADYVKALTGTGDEITAKIQELFGVMEGLDQLDILGLTVENLMKMQKEGEGLGDAFGRIATQWSEYQNLFLSDSEKLGLAQKSLAQSFADLGIQMPKSNAEFRKLIEGLDLSTESGRTLFQALLTLAPAFAAVENAAAGLLAQFRQLAAQRNPALGRSFLEADLKSAVLEFMGRNAWTTGMDWREVARQIGLITSYEGGVDDFRRYSPEDQALINRILGITTELEGLGDAATSAAIVLGGLQSNAAAAANSWTSIKLSLWDYLRGLYTDGALSPLDPSQQLDTLKTRFTTTLAQARGGNVEAGQSLSGLIQQILTLGLDQFGSTGRYIDLFNWVTGLAGDFVQPGGGAELNRLAYEEQKAQTKLLAENNAIMKALYERMGTTAAYVADATIASGEQVAGAYENAAAAVVRR